MVKKWKSDEGSTKEKIENMEGVFVLKQLALQNISQCLVNMTLKSIQCNTLMIHTDGKKLQL